MKQVDKWLILDRDGVINHDSDQFIKSPEEWNPIPGSLEAIAALNLAGYRLVVISNQSGIARGLFSLETLDAIHRKFRRRLSQHGGQVERIYFCPHGPEDSCTCRKPLAGLFQQFSNEFKLSLKGVYAIGDSVRDLEAAQSAGASGVLVRTGKGTKSEQALRQLKNSHPLSAVPVYNDLSSFAEQLLTPTSRP